MTAAALAANVDASVTHHRAVDALVRAGHLIEAEPGVYRRPQPPPTARPAAEAAPAGRTGSQQGAATGTGSTSPASEVPPEATGTGRPESAPLLERRDPTCPTRPPRPTDPARPQPAPGHDRKQQRVSMPDYRIPEVLPPRPPPQTPEQKRQDEAVRAALRERASQPAPSRPAEEQAEAERLRAAEEQRSAERLEQARQAARVAGLAVITDQQQQGVAEPAASPTPARLGPAPSASYDALVHQQLAQARAMGLGVKNDPDPQPPSAA